MAIVQSDLDFNRFLLNVVPNSATCWCSLHQGDTLRQIDGSLPNGTPVRIMQDKFGYHVAIGSIVGCPPPVSEDELVRIIEEAIREQ